MFRHSMVCLAYYDEDGDCLQRRKDRPSRPGRQSHGTKEQHGLDPTKAMAWIAKNVVSLTTHWMAIPESFSQAVS